MSGVGDGDGRAPDGRASDAPADTALSDTVSADESAGRTAGPSPETLRSAPVKAGDSVGRYVIVKRLGTGGMGSVYRARDPELGRDVAIKLLHPHLADQRARLLGEGQAIARLAHGNVVAIHDVGTYRDGLFIAMELVEGTTLRGWLAAAKHPVPAILDAFARAGAGLAAAHAAGIVHRDFKPDNVLVGAGDPARVVVTDFGLARAFGADAAATDTSSPSVDATRTGAFTGTPLYMSPEQFTGDAIGAASDQFSFCVALYEAVYRERPFGNGITVAAIMEAVTEHPPKPQPATAAVSARIRDAILRGLAREPAARFPSMTALLAALAPPPRTTSRRAMVVATVAAGAVVVAIAVALIAARGNRRPEAPAAGPLDPCVVAAAHVDSLWSPTIRAGVATALGTLDTAAADLAQIDGFVARWKQRRTEACTAPKVATCLDHLLPDLERLPEAWAKHHAIAAHWVPLPDPDRCTRDHPDASIVTQLRDSIAVGDNFEAEPSGARYAVEHERVLRVSELAAGTQRRFPIADDRFLAGWIDPTHVLFDRNHGLLSTLDIETSTWRDEPPAPAGIDILTGGPGWRDVIGTRTTDDALVVTARTDPAAAPEILAAGSEHGVVVAAVFSPDGRRIATVQTNRSTSDTGNVSLVVYQRGAKPESARQRLRGSENRKNNYELAWLGNDRLVVEASSDPSLVPDLWVAGGSDLAAFARPPALALRGEGNTSYILLEPSGDHLIGLEVQESKAGARVVGGHATTLPRTDDLYFTDVTRDGAWLLATVDGQAERISVADGTVTRYGHGLAFVHGDRIATYTICDGGGLCIVERDPAAPATAPPARFASVPGFPKDIGCSAGACVEISADDTTHSMELRPLGPEDEFGAAVVVHGIDEPRSTDTRVSPDGRRVALTQPKPAAVDVFALDRGPSPGAPTRWLAADAHCFPTRSYWIDDATLAVAEWCHGPSRVVEVQLGHPPKVVYEAPSQIEDMVVAADHTLFVTEHAISTRVVALQGL